MTEYELIDAAGTFNSATQAWYATYFTVVSGYLITAYLVGKNLSKSQVVIISGAFVIFSGLCAYGAAGSGARLMEVVTELTALNPNRGGGVGPVALAIASSILIFGIFVSLKFMWDIRHPKKE